jgi:hypothetical protein
MSVLLIPLLVALPAHAGGGDYPFRLQGGLCGGIGPPSIGACSEGRLLVEGRTMAFEAAAREGLFTDDTRVVGALFFGARATLPAGAHFRGGFAHNHEVPWAVLQDEPIGSVLGSATGIRHRSGVELGLGYSYWFDDAWLGDRLSIYADGASSLLFDDKGPLVYAWLEGGVSIAVGARRDR